MDRLSTNPNCKGEDLISSPDPVGTQGGKDPHGGVMRVELGPVDRLLVTLLHRVPKLVLDTPFLVYIHYYVLFIIFGRRHGKGDLKGTKGRVKKNGR